MDISVFIVLLLLVFLILSTPVAVAVGISSMVYLLATNVNLQSMPQRMFTTVDASTLFAVPLFLLAGFLMNMSGITDRIFRFANVLVRHITGGLAHVNVVASTIFASMSGSSVADAAGLGAIEIKAMTDAGYDRDFACAVTLASCTISPIIPPSIIMVIYGVAAEVSIGRLFMAGVVPGVLMAGLLMLVNFVLAKRHDYPVMKRASLREVVRSFVAALLPLGTPVIILGGIIGGIFTATEAAAVAVLYTLLLDLLVFRELTWRKFKDIVIEVGLTSSAILFLVSVTGIFSWVLAREQVPLHVMRYFTDITTNPVLILLSINFVLLLLGCFLDATPIVLLMVPILMPLLRTIGYSPVAFGIVISINTMIGLTTPPVGVSLYSVSAVSGVPIHRIVRKVLPYWVALLASLFVVTYLPEVSLTLPNLIFGPGR